MGGAALLGGLAGGLVEGYFGRKGEQRQERKQLSDEERQAHYDQITQGISGAQAKLATLAPGSPEYAATSDDITKAHGMLTDLFHPSTGPGALAHLGRIVSEKWLHRPQEPQTQTEMVRGLDQPRMVTTPGTDAVAAATYPGMVPGTTITTPDLPAIAPGKTVVPARAGPLVPTQVPIPRTAEEAKQRTSEFMTRLGIAATPAAADTNQFAEYRSQLKQAIPTMSEQDLDQAVRIHAGVDPRPVAEKAPATLRPMLKEYKLKDGTVAWLDASKPDDLPEGATAMGGQPHESTAQQELMIRGWFPKGPTAAQREWGIKRYQRLLHPDTSSTHESLQYNTVTGDPIIVPLHSQASKGWGPEGPPPPDENAVPSQAGKRTAGTPADLKKKLAASVPPKSTGQKTPDSRLAGLQHATPAQTAADKAVKVAQASYLDVQKASVDPTPVGDQGVILAWLRGRVNRVTATEIAAVNNLGGAELKLEGNIAHIVSGKMTDQQRAWFLRSAKDNYESAQTVAARGTGGGDGAGAGNKKHSLSKAMQLPFNKGKSEADVRKDLEGHGYEVVP